MSITNEDLVRAQKLDDSIKKVLQFHDRFERAYRFLDEGNVILPKEDDNREVRDVVINAGKAAQKAIEQEVKEGMFAEIRKIIPDYPDPFEPQ